MEETFIELTRVSRYFYKGSETIHAVDDISLHIQRGDFIAIQGSSGSGKSTLMYLMGALDWPTHGQILFDGHDISKMNDRSLSQLRLKCIGFIFQSFNLIADLDVLQNAALPLKYAGVKKQEREEQARHALEIVGMTQRLTHLPGELSSGEEQRVTIARALVNHPDVILADEPSGNLDSSNRDNVLTLFADLHAAGQTIVVVTHDPIVAQAANCQWRMQDGRLS